MKTFIIGCIIALAMGAIGSEIYMALLGDHLGIRVFGATMLLIVSYSVSTLCVYRGLNEMKDKDSD